MPAKLSRGFPPVSGSDARILILGSLPGERSLAEQQYYAHPQNAFWRIMQALYGIHGSYTERLRQLVENRIALWDVLHSCARPGSLDASIAMHSATTNDFDSLFRACREIRLVAFNGKKAEHLFRRFVDIPSAEKPLQQIGLPSTSPAYAAMRFPDKLDAWRQVLGPFT